MRLQLCFAVLLLGYCTSVLATELRLYTEEYRLLSYIENGKLTGMAVEVAGMLVQQGMRRDEVELQYAFMGNNSYTGFPRARPGIGAGVVASA